MTCTPFWTWNTQSRNMNFHIRGILTLWLGFTWSGILAVRSAALYTWPALVVSCHGNGPEPYTWQVSTLSPPADNANTGKRCVATGQLFIHACHAILIRKCTILLNVCGSERDKNVLSFHSKKSILPCSCKYVFFCFSFFFFNPAPMPWKCSAWHKQ